MSNNSRHIDVFNGDADGLCALIQLRLAEPVEVVELVTGIKRDIVLLDRVAGEANDRITVLDISLDRNRAEVNRLVAAGAYINYFDHHYPGASIPENPRFKAMIDESPEVCTSLLVDRYIGKKYSLWAIVAAFGDNLNHVGENYCSQLGLNKVDAARLRELGELLNYNGYGNRVEDLHFHPAALFRALQHVVDPREAYISLPEFTTLAEGYASDISQAEVQSPRFSTETAAIYYLPDAAWARRVVGVWANQLSQTSPCRAHMILCPDGEGELTVSLRAAKTNPYGASAFCRGYPNGGGREAAAGINCLPESLIDPLSENFIKTFGSV